MMRILALTLLLTLLTACDKGELSFMETGEGFAQDLQALADVYVEDGFPGMILLVDHPKEGLIVVESGEASLEDNLLLNKDHLFHSASLMKTYTAVCIFQLVEQGILNLEENISTYLSEELVQRIPNGQTATLKSLLNHSSGIPDFVNQSNYIDDLISYTEGGQYPGDELDYIVGLKPDFPMGSKHQYCNTGFYILQLIVAQMTGQSFESYLNENIFDPLGLKKTVYKNLPTTLDYASVPEYYIDWDSNGRLSNSTNLENLASQTFEGFSGLTATIGDYHKFLKGLFVEGMIINSNSIEQMKVSSSAIGFGYGLGLEVIKSSEFPDKYGHKGGTQASFFYYPEEDTFVLSMLNYSFLSGNSPFDRKALVADELGERGTLVGEIEHMLFK